MTAGWLLGGNPKANTELNRGRGQASLLQDLKLQADVSSVDQPIS